MHPRPIGSDFETEDRLISRLQIRPPWHDDDLNTVYLETGRQALAIAASALRQSGYSTIFLPSFLCESMIEPFKNDWNIQGYPITNLFRADLNALDRALQHAPARSAVLFAEYFGNWPEGPRKKFVDNLQQQGIAVIEDETHRIFAPGGIDATYRFASLRKILPVGDGSYLQSTHDRFERLDGIPLSNSARWLAMDRKAAELTQAQGFAHQEQFRRENELLERPGRLRRATPRTLSAVGNFDYPSLTAIRLENSSALRRAIAERTNIRPALPLQGTVESHLVLNATRPQELQAHLARRQIFCPIHWPRPPGWEHRPWRDDILSIPVDHRYDVRDMMRIADQLEEWDPA